LGYWCLNYKKKKLALFSKDLFGIEENHPNFTEEGFVNFTKMRLIWNVIKKIMQYKGMEYRLESSQELQSYLRNLKVFSDEELFHRSNQLEPREGVTTRQVD
jgi:hypothetical protein